MFEKYNVEQKLDLHYRYPVVFTENLFSKSNGELKQFFKDQGANQSIRLLCIVDENLLEGNPKLIQEVEEYFSEEGMPALVSTPILLKGGEALKSRFDIVNELYSAVAEYNICRHSYIMGIGGGTLMDIAGYVAATSHRGVRMLRVPTTVLAQSDAALGVKTSMNFDGKKNFVGTFTPPNGVFCDIALLDSLPEEHYLPGYSEAVKVAILQDEPFLKEIEDLSKDIISREREGSLHVIAKCAELHLKHIATSGDPFEFGSSRPLDFGHWAAHKLEQMSDFKMTHGESVAFGVALDVTYSYLVGKLSEESWRRCMEAFKGLKFELYHPLMEKSLNEPENPESMLHGLEEFRQHLGGRLTVMLIDEIGSGYEVDTMDMTILKDAVLTLKEY